MIRKEEFRSDNEGIERFIIQAAIVARTGNRERLTDLLFKDRGVRFLVDVLAPLVRAKEWGRVDLALFGYETDIDPPEAVTLDSYLSDSGLDYRAITLLENAGYERLRDLVGVTTETLQLIPNCGDAAIESIHHWLAVATRNSVRARIAPQTAPRKTVVKISDERLSAIIRANPDISDDVLGQQTGVSKSRVWRMRQQLARSKNVG